jgi:hypothetical protein
MASDLSQLIQDGLCNTLNGLLAKETSLKETTKVHPKDLSNIEVLRVDSIFDFEKLSSTLKFVIPAYSATHIFNTMMGDTEAKPSLTIDDDTADAISEFASNTSGSLTTAINGSAFEDLGSVKFNIAKNEVTHGKDITDLDNAYRFSIDLEGTDITIFILFDDAIIPFLETLSKSPVTFYEEVKEEEPEDEVKEEEPEDEVKEEEPKEEVKKEEPKEEVKKEEASDKKQNPDIKKISKLVLEGEDKKIKLIIVGVAGLLILTLLAGSVMYFMGMFDQPEPVIVKQDTNTTKQKAKDQVEVIKYTTLKKVNFKVSDIDINRLNGRLSVLTKNNVLNDQELKAQKIKEKQRLANLDKEKDFIEFAKGNKEEPLVEKKETIEIEKNNATKQTVQEATNEQPTEELQTTKETLEENQEQVILENNNQEIVSQEVSQEQKVEEDIVEQKQLEQENSKLKFILADSLKYKFFKDILAKTTAKEASISICSNEDGKTIIYIGPFENEDLQNNMQSLITQEDPNIEVNTSDITNEEFNARCNF